MPHTYEMYVTYENWEKIFFGAVIPTIYYYRRLNSSRVKNSRKERKEAYVVFN